MNFCNEKACGIPASHFNIGKDKLDFCWKHYRKYLGIYVPDLLKKEK